MDSGGTAKRAGLVKKLDRVEGIVARHTEQLADQADGVASLSSDVNAALFRLEASLKAHISAVKKEVTDRLDEVSAEVQDVKQQLLAQRGEQRVLGQQNKDVSRRIDELGEVVAELKADIVGDDDDDEEDYHVGGAGSGAGVGKVMGAGKTIVGGGQVPDEDDSDEED